MRPNVYVTRIIPEEALALLKTVGEVRIWSGELAVPYDVLLEEVKNADGLLCMLSDRIDAAIIDAASRLKVISTYAVGYDNIDIARATQRGIAAGNTPGVLTETTADLAFALLMSAARSVAEGDRYVREGRWKVAWGPMMLLGQDIHGSTLGIVGMGRIGSAIAFHSCDICDLHVGCKRGLSLPWLWPTTFPAPALQGCGHGSPSNNRQVSLSRTYSYIAEGYRDITACLHHQKIPALCCCPFGLYGEGIPLRILLQSSASVLRYTKYPILSRNMGSVPIVFGMLIV